MYLTESNPEELFYFLGDGLYATFEKGCERVSLYTLTSLYPLQFERKIILNKDSCKQLLSFLIRQEGWENLMEGINHGSTN